MRLTLFIIILFILNNCSKPKTVMICGDHVCINKTEAEQFFEDNLSIEIRILNKNIQKKIDLVELNLKENASGKRQISVLSKKNTNKNVKTLSKKEIIKIKENIKSKKKEKKLTKKIINNKKKVRIDEIKNIDNKSKKKKLPIDSISNTRADVVDICTILKKCSIDEISKYLQEQGKKKGFPDITKIN